MDYHQYILDWLKDERNYQVDKFGIENDDRRTEAFNREWGRSINDIDDNYWINQIQMYLHRAQILGLEHPNGRQALAKATATLVMMLESATRIYGALPEPGVTSGENLDNLRNFANSST